MITLFRVLLSLGILSIVLIAVPALFEGVLERHRRKEHPKYFEYWDNALALSFERGTKYKKYREHFEYQVELCSEGLIEGECTNRYYTDKMNDLITEYQEFCDWFKEEDKVINELLRQADIYAKEHDLMWGILYD
jgi:hypothetical protein